MQLMLEKMVVPEMTSGMLRMVFWAGLQDMRARDVVSSGILS